MKVLHLFVVLLMLPLAAEARKITLVADMWPPFNGEPGSAYEGYMIDIARAIFEKEGFAVEYRNVPWERAVADVRTGVYDGAVGASKTDAQGFVFPREELARNLLSFYVRRDFPWRFTGVESLAEVRLGVASGYDYRQWLNRYIEENSGDPGRVQPLAGDRPLQRNLQKLQDGRIDVVVDNEAAIRWEAQQIGMLQDIHAAGQGLEPALCYIAFSPVLSESRLLANILTEGIRELRRTGRLQEILARYGLKDWKGGGGD